MHLSEPLHTLIGGAQLEALSNIGQRAMIWLEHQGDDMDLWLDFSSLETPAIMGWIIMYKGERVAWQLADGSYGLTKANLPSGWQDGRSAASHIRSILLAIAQWATQNEDQAAQRLRTLTSAVQWPGLLQYYGWRLRPRFPFFGKQVVSTRLVSVDFRSYCYVFVSYQWQQVVER